MSTRDLKPDNMPGSLQPGDLVRLSDGESGAIERVDGEDAHVIHIDRRAMGRGPWIYPRGGLERAPSSTRRSP